MFAKHAGELSLILKKRIMCRTGRIVLPVAEICVCVLSLLCSLCFSVAFMWGFL